MKKIPGYLAIASMFFLYACSGTNNESGPIVNTDFNEAMAKGWNTWNTRSVLSFVLLPQSYSFNLMLQDGKTGSVLTEALIGRRGDSAEQVTPGPHSYDGSYSEQTVSWKNIKIKVQSAYDGKEFVVLVRPLNEIRNDYLLLKPKIIWEGTGSVKINSSDFSFTNDSSTIAIHVQSAGKIEIADSLLKCSLSGKTYLSSSNKSLNEIENFISVAEKTQADKKTKFGADSTLYDAMQTVLAWDIIYEPVHKRVIAPVSRIWNCDWNGWVLFDWDTYFASLMFSFANKELAYANAMAITNEITERGFIPNFGSGICKSEDRSQPPVGSYVIGKIYERYHEKWFLEKVFDKLLTWNRWWEKNRDVGGYLCWGSDPYNTGSIPDWLRTEVGKKQAAMWESGLDNSPMYDAAVFDSSNHKLMLADVGLMSMYVWDCKNLAAIARELGKSEIINELDKRAKKYSQNLEQLWNEKAGIYMNKDLVTGQFNERLSPTNFYPLLTGVPSQQKAERMINEHFYNPKEFWGPWILPSISRSDSGFKDNTYWRGRIWAPMNMLVYIGIINYNLPNARKDLVEKSARLIMKSWQEERHIYENYNSVSGIGSDVANSDKFYHWGALLAYISLVEHNKGKKK